MSCALSAAYTQDGCNEGIGGTHEMYVIARADVAFTETTGVITGFVNASTKRFYKYVLPRETANVKTTLNSDVKTGTQYHTHEVSLVFNRMKSATRNELKLLTKNNVCIIYKDENGTYWLSGRANGLDASGGGSDSGTAPGDRNGYTRTLVSNEPEDVIEVTAGLIATLETPGA